MSSRQDTDQEVKAAGDARMTLTAAINDLFPQLLESCPIHFAVKGTFETCSDRCDLIDMSTYSLFRNAFTFKRFTYCFACGVPNDKRRDHYYAPAFHHVDWYKSKGACPYAHYMFKVIYALWFQDELRPVFCHELGIDASNEEEFTEWAVQDHDDLTDTTYFNGMTLMLWYCRHVGRIV